MTDHHDEATAEQLDLEAAPTPLWVVAEDGRLINLAYCTDVLVEAKQAGAGGKRWRITARPGGRHTITLAEFDTEQAARGAIAWLASAVGAIHLDG